MKKIFRPFNFSKPGQCFQDAALTLAISALLSSLIVIGLAFWAIFHPPRFHQSNYAAYYSAEEYNRLVNVKNKPPLSDSSSGAARPVDAKL